MTLLLSALLTLAAATPHDAPRGVLFERNAGAYDDAVRFVARSPSSTTFVTDAALVAHVRDAGGETVVLRTTFVGARPGARPRPHGAASTRVNHLRGDDRDAWTTADTWRRLAWRDLWPGVDLVLHDADGRLEYDFVVAPGVDPRVIAVAHAGVDALDIAPDGSLRLATPLGDLHHTAPVLYQDGPDGRVLVDGAFVVDGDVVRFDVGPYDTSRELVIDPVLGWATYIGGAAWDVVRDVAVFADGSAVVCGETESPDLPTGAGVLQPDHANTSWEDAFVAKISPDGSAFEWITYLGGSDPSSPYSSHVDEAYSVAVDAAGHVIVGGRTLCDDFPTVAPFDATNQGQNGFVAKLTPDGASLVFSTYVGGAQIAGPGNPLVTAVHADAAGAIYVAGENHSAAGAIPVTPGAYDVSPVSSGTDGFVLKLTAAGQSVWGTYLGGDVGPNGSPQTKPWDIDVDAAGRVYVAGWTTALDFPLVGAWDAIGPNGTTDLYELWACRLSADGSTLEYSTYVGGDDEETVSPIGVACDDEGRMWVVGGTRSQAFPTTPGAFDTTFNGGQKDGFVLCVDTDLSGPASAVFSTYLGAPNTDELHSVALCPDGAVVVSGSASHGGFPLVEPWSGDLNAYDVTIAVLDATGQLTESTYFGSDGADKSDGTAVAVGPDGDLYVAFSANGVGASSPFAAQPSYAGGVYDGVVSRWRRQPITCQPDLGSPGAGDTQMSVCGGDLTAGTLSALRIDTAWGNRPGVLFVGFDANPTPWPAVGGSLVPVPVLLQVPFVLDGEGDVELLLPGGLGPAHLVFQAVVEQPVGPNGLSLGNAVDVVWP